MEQFTYKKGMSLAKGKEHSSNKEDEPNMRALWVMILDCGQGDEKRNHRYKNTSRCNPQAVKTEGYSE